MDALLNVKTLNTMRRALYGETASLSFYTVTPAAGETLLFTSKSGWHAARETSSQRVTIWISKDATDDQLRTQLHVGGKLQIKTQFRRQSYRISEVKTMAQLNTGWVLMCDPIDASTDDE